VPEFVTVARADGVMPGELKCVRAGEEEIALTRIGDEFYSVQNTCLHLGGPLCHGRLDNGVLTCPWHGWQYDVKTGNNMFDLAIQLRTYPVKRRRGQGRLLTI
jgi:3-phenylpropionate/trans-cinnamate dioxygenase ferredoxin component